MPYKNFIGPIVALSLLGAGCSFANQRPAANSVNKINVNLDQKQAKQTDLPCLSFSHRDGFIKWLDAYEAGNNDLAVNLAINAKLSKKPDSKLIENLRQSAASSTAPAFLCVLDDKGENVAWSMDATAPPPDVCRNLFYVSINNHGTISELRAKGRSTGCDRLCKPRIQSPQAFLWQCDLRKSEKRTTWSEAYMDRKTGEVVVGDCWKDDLGMLSGCTPPQSE